MRERAGKWISTTRAGWLGRQTYSKRIGVPHHLFLFLCPAVACFLAIITKFIHMPHATCQICCPLRRELCSFLLVSHALCTFPFACTFSFPFPFPFAITSRCCSSCLSQHPAKVMANIPVVDARKCMQLFHAHVAHVT